FAPSLAEELRSASPLCDLISCLSIGNENSASIKIRKSLNAIVYLFLHFQRCDFFRCNDFGWGAVATI
ncbi:hypothetical protein, partial [Salmonella enterica]|uniref:hypothetical protein n=1 Tax=Salmonella enterica TaxID=28901 RepID=UPI001CB6BB9D